MLKRFIYAIIIPIVSVLTVAALAISLGYIFYNDFPDIFTISGALIITLSGIYVLKQRSNKNN